MISIIGAGSLFLQKPPLWGPGEGRTQSGQADSPSLQTRHENSNSCIWTFSVDVSSPVFRKINQKIRSILIHFTLFFLPVSESPNFFFFFLMWRPLTEVPPTPTPVTWYSTLQLNSTGAFWIEPIRNEKPSEESFDQSLLTSHFLLDVMINSNHFRNTLKSYKPPRNLSVRDTCSFIYKLGLNVTKHKTQSLFLCDLYILLTLTGMKWINRPQFVFI